METWIIFMNKEVLRRKVEKIKKMKADKRYQQVMGFLIHKGLLLGNREYEYKDRINIKDALWAARIEPRILEVLPAALLHFPGSVDDERIIPHKMKRIMDDIMKGKETGEDYESVKYHTMKRWADLQLKDKRTKPISEKKKQANFRLSPLAMKNLTEFADRKNLSKTQALEELVMKWGG